MNAFSLKNKTILITGSSSGIGYATAKQCAASGAKLIITGRNEQQLQHLAKELGHAVAELVIADLAAQEEIDRLVDRCTVLDGVIHSAGINEPAALKFLKRKHIEPTFAVNFMAPVLLSSALLAKNKINKFASFVFISSVSADRPYTGGSVYSASKSALEAYSRSLAIECAHLKIRSNCIAPAMVKTPMFEKIDSESMQSHGEHYLLGFGEPADVANTAVFLLSDASSWITGTTLTLDGGLRISQKK